MEYYEAMVGDGESTTFYFTFPFFGVNDIHVKVNDVEQTNYIMTPNQTPNDADTEYTGGTVEFLTAPANGDRITIYREIELVRHIDYQPTKKPESHQMNQDANQLMGALRELNIKLKNTLDLATIPTLADLLAELTTIRNALPDFVTTADLNELNDTIANIQDALNALNEYDYVTESQLPTADNNYTWYRKYKSGWVEQGQKVSTLSNNTQKTITLPVALIDGDRAFPQISCAQAGFGAAGTVSIRVATNGATVNIHQFNSANASMGVCWTVWGIVA